MTEPNLSLCLRDTADCPVLEKFARLEEEIHALQRQVVLDPLTGLYNKRHFEKSLETEMERSRRSLQPLSVILADLDHFKSINDRFGHPVGDKALRCAADILKAELRMIDIPCRYGGEEFVIILPATPLLTAIQVAERLRTALKHKPVEIENGSLTLTASFGVSTYSHDRHTSVSRLIQQADQKLYQAKKLGRDQVCAEIPSSGHTQVSEEERTALFDDDESGPKP